jgi:O-antigen ligase
MPERRDVVNGWLGTLLVLPWVSAYTSGPTPNAWPWLVSACCAVLLYFFRGRLTVGLISTSWVVAAVLSALIGIVQYFGLAQAFGPWISQAGPAEAFANLRQRNQFATLTSIGFVALLGALARRTPAGHMPGWAHLAVSLLAIGNAVSDSRTGLLQWVLVLSLSAWWFLPSQRHLVRLALQAVATYLVAVAALPWVLSATTGFGSEGLWGRLVDAPTCASRRVLWSNVLDLIAQKPWLGWGWGELDYAHFMNLYQGARFCEILDNAHNLPLHLAVELGIPLSLAVCIGTGWLVWRLKPWRETLASRQMAWAVLAVIMLHSLLEYPLWYGPFQMAFILSAGILWWTAGKGTHGGRGGPGNGDRGGAAEVPGRTYFLHLSFAAGLMAILVCIGIDYHRVSQIYLPVAQRSAGYRDDTLNKVRLTWFFRNQSDFAELSMTALKPDTAVAVHALAQRLIHYSPEPSVIEKLIESAVMLGKDDEALFYLARYRAAFPQDHARWARAHAMP